MGPGSLDVPSAHPGDSRAGFEDHTLKNERSDFAEAGGSLPCPAGWHGAADPELLALGPAEAPEPAWESSERPRGR